MQAVNYSSKDNSLQGTSKKGGALGPGGVNASTVEYSTVEYRRVQNRYTMCLPATLPRARVPGHPLAILTPECIVLHRTAVVRAASNQNWGLWFRAQVWAQDGMREVFLRAAVVFTPLAARLIIRSALMLPCMWRRPTLSASLLPSVLLCPPSPLDPSLHSGRLALQSLLPSALFCTRCPLCSLPAVCIVISLTGRHHRTRRTRSHRAQTGSTSIRYCRRTFCRLVKQGSHIRERVQSLGIRV